MPFVRITGISGKPKDSEPTAVKRAIQEAARRNRIKIADYRYKDGTVTFYLTDDHDANQMMAEFEKTKFSTDIVPTMDSLQS